jgi:hypothetical protein
MTSVVRLALSFAALILFVSAGGPCTCGPDYCKDDPRYLPALNKKKDQMRKAGYPERLISLLDRDGPCYARVQQAPDVFTVKVVYSDGSSGTVPWSVDEEERAKQQVLSGALREYYEFNVSRAFNCCGDPKYNERDDWDANKDMNLGLVVACGKSGNDVNCAPGR